VLERQRHKFRLLKPVGFSCDPVLEMFRSAALAFVALAGSATAFSPMASSSLGSLRSRSAAISPAGFAPSSQKFRSARAPMALRMQSEDDKAKASGVAAALIGLILSGFSPLIAVLLGGAAVYAGATPPCTGTLARIANLATTNWNTFESGGPWQAAFTGQIRRHIVYPMGKW